jgi:hypothetical protein
MKSSLTNLHKYARERRGTYDIVEVEGVSLSAASSFLKGGVPMVYMLCWQDDARPDDDDGKGQADDNK